MYQCYVVKQCGDDLCNIILGDEFATPEDAYDMADFWQSQFGKVENVVIEPAGTAIPIEESEKHTLGDYFHDVLRLLAGM